MLNPYENTLLLGWEEVYKRSQLTLWVLLALKDGPKHMLEIKNFILVATNDLLEVDDKSMYRALRRFASAEMVEYETTPSESGPDKKIYSLTYTGMTVLNEFIKRNIIEVFNNPSIQELMIA